MNFNQFVRSNPTDEWYTTREAVELIVPYLKLGGVERVLCPFDKAESEFVNVLTENGFDVTYSHIDTGTDFFEINNLGDYDAVVSNPPFSKREDILKRLFEADVRFALIINFNGLFDSNVRWDLFKNNSFELLIPKGRMGFFGENYKLSQPSHQSVYVCRGILPRQIVFDGAVTRASAKGYMMLRKINKMYEMFAQDTDGHKCGECNNLEKITWRGKTYYKCRPYGKSQSESSDWRLKWDACGLFNKDYEGDIPIIKLITHETYDDQIEGQMSLFDGEE